MPAQRGLIQFVILTIVLIGIGIGLYLIRNPQIFKPKASDTAINAFESHYNPFGDPWYMNTGPNSNIPIALTTGCHRRGPKANTSP